MYEALEKKTVYAKHLKRTHDLTGVKREMVYYIYAQILDGVRVKKFRAPYRYNTETVRIDLFTIQVSSDFICIDTIYCHCKIIKSFKIKGKEAEDYIKAIESAVNLVGLEFEEVKDFSAYKNFKIYLTIKKGAT